MASSTVKHGVETRPNTKKPTGLSISRSNKKFVFSWKIASEDHGAGQQLVWREKYHDNPIYVHTKDNKGKDIVKPVTNFSKEGSNTLNKTQTSTTHKIDKSYYYPTTNRRLYEVWFQVRGQRKKYTKENVKDPKDHKKYNVQIDPKWSSWVDKSFSIERPYNPIVSESLNDSSDLTTTFAWSCNVSTTSHRMFTDYEWETKLTSGTSKPDWSVNKTTKHADGIDSDTGDSDTGSASVNGNATAAWTINKDGGAVIIVEDSSKVSLAPGATSHTRWFRVRARGPAGASDWVVTKHVYACPKAVKKIYYDKSVVDAADKAIANANKTRGPVITATGNREEETKERIKAANARKKAVEGAEMTIRKKKASGSVIKMSWDCDVNSAYPIDYCEVEYYIATPTVDISSSTNSKFQSKIITPTFPESPSVAGRVYDSKGWSSFSFILSEAIDDEQIMYVRVVTVHDRIRNPGVIFEVVNSQGDLKPPTGLSIATSYNPETSKIEINRPTLNSNTAVTNAFIAIYFRSNKKANTSRIVGIVRPGETGTQILELPKIGANDTPGLGMKAIVGDFTPNNFTYETPSEKFNVTEKWTSDGIIWDSSAGIPMPPNLTVDKVDGYTDMVKADWDWKWTQANAAELSWSDSKYGWSSTEEPSTYIVKATNTSEWYIPGLEPAMWYFRCRLLNQTGDTTSYGTYSKIEDCDLATNPIKPIVESDDYTVIAGKSFTLFWRYGSEDGGTPDTPEATFCNFALTTDTVVNPDKTYYTYSNGEYTPVLDPSTLEIGSYYELKPNSTPFVYMTSQKGKYEQSNKFSTGATKLHAAFPVGATTYIAIRTKSSTGKKSDWSDPVGITVVPKLVPSITATTNIESTTYDSYAPTDDTSIESGKTYYILVDDQYVAVAQPVAADLENYFEKTVVSVPVALRTLPFTVTVAGNGNAGTSAISITRKENYILRRPELKVDELPYDGFEGETIATVSKDGGAGTLRITKESLIGTLDDGEKYLINVTLTDTYGQTATLNPPMEFEVRWAHQALMPTATIVPDNDDLITTIVVPAPTGTVSGDSFDIYRLSADAPEKIIEDGVFGTTYVDPYPTLGEFGGHRVVFKTKNGDFITENNLLAMVDYDYNDDNIIDYFGIVIDFAGEQVRLPYDVSVSNKWSKDFTEVKYLGGSIKGFWNPATSRTASLSTTVVIQEDEDGYETIKSMRRLANYAGICHIRTPEGSSYAANVNVNEDREERWVNRLAKFSLDITRVNPEGFDGVTLADWESNQQ